MGFTLQLVQDFVEVDAGATTPVSVTVVNRGDTADRYELELEGIDPEWKAVPVPVFTADPHETHGEKIFLKPPRASESVAGNYPFVVKVRSLESGEQKTAQGVLRVKSYHHLTMEIDPKKGFFSPTAHRNVFTVTVMNLGNTEHTLQLVGSDPEDNCTYEFQTEQVTVAPGQQKEVTVTVQPVSTQILSSGRLIGFSIAARSIDTPSVVTTAQAQLEHRSLLSPTILGVVVVLALIVATWLMMMPKPPGIQLTVSPMSGKQGDTVNVGWTAHDANHIVVDVHTPDGKTETLYDGPNPAGSVPWTLGAPGVETFTATVSQDSRNGSPDTKTLTVSNAPPPPEISWFKPDQRRIKLGTSVTLRWKVDQATQVTVTPDNKQYDASLGSCTVTPTQTGQAQYTLVANGPGGEVSSLPVTVDVYNPSDAQILAFDASPKEVEEGNPTPVTLSWTVTKAVRVTLTGPGITTPTDGVGLTGSMQVAITDKSVFVLTATDEDNRATSKRVVVFFKRLAPPVPPPTDQTTTGTINPAPTTGTPTTGTQTTGAATTGTATTGTGVIH